MGRLSYLPKPVRASLVSVDGIISLVFKVNPRDLARVEQYTLAGSQAPGATDARRQYVGGADRPLNFDVILDAIGKARPGEGCVLTDLNKLESFTYPHTDNPIRNVLFTSPPKALLTYGPRVWEGNVISLNITEQQHNYLLEPTFVRVAVTFIPDLLDSDTNEAMALQRRLRST